MLIFNDFSRRYSEYQWLSRLGHVCHLSVREIQYELTIIRPPNRPPHQDINLPWLRPHQTHLLLNV